jgi:hypothetical protein
MSAYLVNKEISNFHQIEEMAISLTSDKEQVQVVTSIY